MFVYLYRLTFRQKHLKRIIEKIEFLHTFFKRGIKETRKPDVESRYTNGHLFHVGNK